MVHRYIPKSFATDSKLEFLKWDGSAFGDSVAERPVFDKVKFERELVYNIDNYKADL